MSNKKEYQAKIETSLMQAMRSMKTATHFIKRASGEHIKWAESGYGELSYVAHTLKECLTAANDFVCNHSKYLDIFRDFEMEKLYREKVAKSEHSE